MNSGIPLGGIGAGSVEIRDDGLFHEWQIFGNWRGDELRLSIEKAFFTLHAAPRGGPSISRVLATESRDGLQPVDGIRYTGRFPFAELEYQIEDSPFTVKLTAWSPFIPHDSKNSGLPAAIFEFETVNTSDTDCEAHITGRMWNEVGTGQSRVAQIEHVRGKSLVHWAGSEEYGRGEGTMVFAPVGPSVPELLRAGESRTDTFVLTWHFPTFIDAEGIDIGRMYSNWFSSAEEVADYVVANLPDLRSRTEAFVDVFYNSTLPDWLMEATNAQFTTFFKTAWWTKDNTFAIWEGMACCGCQTADVAYYGSFPVIMFFPDLAKQAMRLTARFQNPSGRIPHFFPGTFQYPDAYHMIDLMPKFTLMVWRDYLWTGDRAYLDEMWPHVHAAMEHNRALDRNGDFIPDDHGIDQTYDGWEFEGASIYVGLINAVAFRAASRMALLQGEQDLADQYWRLSTVSAAFLDRQLWNGEYYDLFHDLGTGVRDKCCMTDQMNGAWYAWMLGFGDVLRRDRVRSSLESILKYNRGPDCIYNGTWREGGPTEGGQWSAIWSGTEYMLASHLVYLGMAEQGLDVAKTVYDRYAKLGRTWDHWECGDHYYRAMVVLTVLFASQGFHYWATEKRLAVDPQVGRENHISPFITPQCWGQLRFAESGSSTAIEIRVVLGELELSRLELGWASDQGFKGRTEAAVDGEPIGCAPRQGAGPSLDLTPAVRLRAGSTLTVALTDA